MPRRPEIADGNRPARPDLDQEMSTMTHPRPESAHRHSLLPAILVTASVLGIMMTQV